MNEEERQSIESLRKNRGVSFAQADIISNWIDKLQKEIEYEKELRVKYERRYDMCKESKDKLKKEIEEMREELQMYVDTKAIYERSYISKNKIRKIIYGNYEDLEIILLIKKLLEE